ncbi:hypothetical protein FIBSPDRAFT_79493 [Athelia psychrophila]|uniref:Uncharacterized protein n=1 Tax=Athelia psychrophila TaxID=1759441 RepID=A0A166E8S0_9AGAM|nr:hypothetical protein FIBSPDRAFT_79493 [Fibularhizoctonia sp. CBS 109695]
MIALNSSRPASAWRRMGAAQCSLGDILIMQSNASEATAILTGARSNFLKMRKRLGAAQCSQRLGVTLRRQCKYTEAENHLMHACDQFLDIGLEDSERI